MSRPKGYKVSDEIKKKISQSNIGKHNFKHTEETRKKMRVPHIGSGIYVRTEAYKNSRIGCKYPNRKLPPSFSEEHRKKMSIYRKGRPLGNPNNWKHSEEWKKKMSEQLKKEYAIGLRKSAFKELKGEKNVNWKGGVTPLNEKIRKSSEYKLWREAVFKRDNYTCIWCGDNRGGNLNADHIKPFALFPELRFAIDNGRTLCIKCHQTTETFGRYTRLKPN